MVEKKMFIVKISIFEYRIPVISNTGSSAPRMTEIIAQCSAVKTKLNQEDISSQPDTSTLFVVQPLVAYTHSLMIFQQYNTHFVGQA